jgi:hypothetical protein
VVVGGEPTCVADSLTGSVIRANAVLNSYGVRGQLWHDLNVILSSAMRVISPGSHGGES